MIAPTNIAVAAINRDSQTITYRTARFELGGVVWQSPIPVDDAHVEKINATLRALLTPMAEAMRSAKSEGQDSGR